MLVSVEHFCQIRLLEDESRQHANMLGEEYVSRQQVNSMEQLFQTAVEGLNSRLKEVEKSKADSYQRVSSKLRQRCRPCLPVRWVGRLS